MTALVVNLARAATALAVATALTLAPLATAAEPDAKFADEVKLLLSRLDLTRPGLEKVQAAGDDPARAANELLAYYQARTTVKHPIARQDRAKMKGNCASEEDAQYADDALKHVFVANRYYPPHFCGDDIDWMTSPVPDKEWIWQLHRMEFWNAMARMYWHTGEEKYARGWCLQFADWVRKNPRDKQHAGAWRSIEAGLRGHSWTELFQRFLDSPSFTPEILVQLLNSFYEHGRYLRTKYTQRSNWGLIEAQGLIFIALTFPEFQDADGWRSEAVRRLVREIDNQVYADGHQQELSLDYHIGCISWFLSPFELAAANGRESDFPADYLKKVERMVEVVMKVGLPDGSMTQFGDAWAGKPGDTFITLKRYAGPFKRDDFLYVATEGKQGVVPGATAFALPQSGFYSMRSGWDKNAICLVLKCGPDGGWHCQHDNGTFELYAGGRHLMPDSGCYIYSGDDESRKWFQQTRVHQTLTLDDQISAYAPRLRLWKPEKDVDTLVVENDSYPGVTHRRAVFFVDKKFFVLVDEAIGEAVGNLSLHFQLAPGKAALDKPTLSVRTDFAEGWNVLVRGVEQKGMTLNEEEGQVSFVYGKKEPRPAFCYAMRKDRADQGVRFITLVAPYADAEPRVAVRLVGQPTVGGPRLDLDVLLDRGTVRIGYELSTDERAPARSSDRQKQQQAASAATKSEEGAAADLRLIKARLVEMLFSQTPQGRDGGRAQGKRGPRSDDADAIERLLTSLRADGSWEDLRYASATPRDLAHGSYETWGSTSSHLTRMETMARAYRTPASRWHGDQKLRDKILLALDYWLRNDFRHVGWWQDQIGTQERLTPTLLLMDELLSPAQRKAAVKIMQRSQIGKMTSANLLWMAGNQIVWGCVADEVAPVAEAYRRIADEVRIASGPEDGIKADNSYYFHGEQLYSGGYGLSFTVSCARLAYIAQGTRFALPPPQVKILADFVLEGQRWMVRGSTFDYSGVGREICRRNKDARGLAQPCRWLESVCPERAADFAAFAKGLTEGSPAGPVGNRHFWKSDTMVQRREGFYASVRMLSSRMKSGECTRGEGLRSHHLADGVTFIYRDGKEYTNVFPVWDWRRLPGITCVHSSKPLIPPEILQPPENPTREQGDDYARRLNGAVASRGTRDFVGGVSDGAYGLAAMDFQRGPLSARKAWFLLDREIVCLGTGINSSADDPVLTSVNQCLLRGPVTLSSGAQPTSLDRGRRELGGLCWVHHDGLGYVFPEKANIVLAADKQEGDWHNLTMASRSQPAAEDVFSLWIDHGHPVADGRYCYLIVPAVEPGGLEAYAKNRAVEVLRNTPAQQAVWHPELKVAMIAFYEPGRLKAGDLEISVDRPCLLLAQKGAAGLELSVSNPESRPLKVGVEVDLRLEGDGCEWLADRKVSHVTFELPAGEDAGKTVVRRLAAR